MKIGMRLYKRADTGVYYVEFRRGVHRSLKTKDGKHARRLFIALKKEALETKVSYILGVCKLSLEEFKKEFLEWSKESKPYGSYEGDLQGFNRLVDVAGKTIRLDRLSKKHLDLVVQACMAAKNSPATINKRIRHLRSAFNKAVDWNYLKINPFAGFKEIPQEKKPPNYITHGAVSSFLAGITDIDLRRIVAAYLATGRRRNEILYLDWADVDFNRRQYFIRRAKRHLSKWYPINAAFQVVLQTIGPRKSGRVFPRWKSQHTISRLVKSALRAVGLGDHKLHDLRHTFAVEYIRAGGSLRVLQDLLGHEQYSTTEIYADVETDHLLEESNRVRLGPVDLVGGKRR